MKLSYFGIRSGFLRTCLSDSEWKLSSLAGWLSYFSSLLLLWESQWVVDRSGVSICHLRVVIQGSFFSLIARSQVLSPFILIHFLLKQRLKRFADLRSFGRILQSTHGGLSLPCIQPHSASGLHFALTDYQVALSLQRLEFELSSFEIESFLQKRVSWKEFDAASSCWTDQLRGDGSHLFTRGDRWFVYASLAEISFGWRSGLWLLWMRCWNFHSVVHVSYERLVSHLALRSFSHSDRCNHVRTMNPTQLILLLVHKVRWGRTNVGRGIHVFYASGRTQKRWANRNLHSWRWIFHLNFEVGLVIFLSRR